MRDVVVIGAGPAGLTTARVLAECGHDVMVLEEHAAVGYPVHCTGLIGAEAFDELDLPRATILGTTGSARFWSASGRSLHADADHTRAAVIDRPAFDRALADRAMRAGAELRTGSTVEGLAIGTGGVSVNVRGETTALRARACVLACGARYRFHRELGLGTPKMFMQTAQVEVPFPRRDDVEVSFGQHAAPRGFGWLVPLQRGDSWHARIGLMCADGARSCFVRFARRLAEAAGLDPDSLPAPHLKILPLAPVRKTYAPRLLAVGDAAGLAKPTTGGGIYYGVLSGQMAGETLDGALRRDALDESSLRVYEKRWRKRLGPEIRAGLAFRAIAGRLNDPAIDALFDVAQSNDLIALLRREANFNWHRSAAMALLKNRSFRHAILSALAIG